MLNKNDPLIGAVKQVMQQSDAQRAAVKAVNEKFGVQDRKALPWQKQSEWDAAYKKVLSEGVESLDEIADTARGKEAVRLAVHRADATVVDSAINPPRSKKGKREAKNAMKTIDRGIAVHKKKGGVLDSYLKRAYGLKKEENVEQHPSIESIQEEIARNLAEKAKSIHETQGEAGLQAFFESLTEEQIAILQMNEGLWDTIKSAAKTAWNAGSEDNAPLGKLATATGATADTSSTMGRLATATGATAVHDYLFGKKDSRPTGSPTGAASGVTTGAGSVTSRGTSSEAPKPTPKPADLNTKTSTPPTTNSTSASSKSVKSIHSTATKSSGMKAPTTKTKIVAKPKVGGTPASRLQSRSQRDGLAGPSGR